MAISSISSTLYSSLLTKPSSAAGGVSSSSAASSSSSGASVSDAIAQELVTLNSAATSKASAAMPIYSAQGQLQHIQNTLLNGERALQADNGTDTSSTDTGSSIVGSLPSTNDSSANITSSTNLAQLLKQNPVYAAFVVQSQMNESLMTALGSGG